MLSSADVQTSGKTFAAAVALRSPATSSSSVSVPASKNFSISCFVGLGDHLDQRLARRCRRPPAMSAGTGAFGELAALVGLEDERLPG